MHIYNANILTSLHHFSRSYISDDYRSIPKIFCKAAQWLNKGVRHELHFAVKYFSKSSNVRSLVNLFQEALAFIPFLPRGDKPILQGLDLLENEIVLDNALMDFEMKSLSKLKRERSDKDLPVSKETVLSLYGSKKKTSQDVKSLFSFLGFFAERNFGSNPFSPLYQKGFSQGLERKQNQKRWISENEVDEKRNEKLSTKAVECVDEIGTLKKGQSFVYFGELSSKASASLSFLDDQFKQHLPSELYQLLQGNDKALSKRLKKDMLKNLKKKGLLNAESNKTRIEESLTEIRDHAKKIICDRLPASWYEGIASSLKQDVEQLLLGSKKEDRSKIAEQLWNKMVDKGFLETVDMAIEQSLSSGQYLVQQVLESVKENVSSTIPKTALDLLSVCGIELNPTESFSIEIKREENDSEENKKYCLIFYSNSLGTTIHPTVGLDEKQGSHLPLVFRNIDAKKLDEDFFGRLISYEAWPQWQLGVSYSLSNVCEELLGLLDVKPEKPESETIYPITSFFSGEALDWLKLHLYHHIGSKAEDFDKLIHYDLPFQLMVDFWPEVHQHQELLSDNSVRHALESMISRLSEKGLELYQEKRISLDEAKRLYATLKEVNKALGVHKNKIPRGHKELSVIIPGELRSSVQAMAEKLSLKPSHFELIKQAFVEIIGDEVEGEIDQMLKDILPNLALKQEIIPAKSENSWKEIFNIDPLKKFIVEASSTRISLLNAYRIYAKISSGMMVIVGLSTRVYFLERFIKVICPQIVKHVPYTARTIAKLIAYFGPSIFRKVLPKKVFAALLALVGLVEEMMGYVLKRIGLHILSAVITRLLKPEKISLLRSSIKQLPTQLLREGEISYELPTDISPRRLVVRSPLSNQKPMIKEKQVKSSSLNIPRPYKFKPTEESLSHFFYDTIYSTYSIKHSIGEENTRVYFNALIRQLPLPGEEGEDFWDKVKDPEYLLGKFSDLLDRLAVLSAKNYSPDEAVEIITSVYSVYVIMDILARRCPEAHLNKELRANGVNFARWMGNPALKISDRKTYEKFKLVARYFDLEPFKKYSKEALNEYQKGRLFDYDRHNFQDYSPVKVNGTFELFWDYCCSPFDLNIGSLINSTEGSYYQQLLQKKEIQEKLKILGVTEKTPQPLQLAILFQNLSFREIWDRYENLINLSEKEKNQFKLLQEKLEKKPQKSDEFYIILPRPFHQLRAAHLMCNGFDRGRSNFKNKDLSIKIYGVPLEEEKQLDICFLDLKRPFSDGNLFFNLVLGESVVATTKKVCGYVHKKFTWLTNHYFTNYKFGSDFNFSKFKHNIRLKIGERALSNYRGGDPLFPEGYLKYHCDYSSLPCHKLIEEPSKRSQSEIMINPCTLSSKVLTTETLRILEMINTHKADQIIRTISLMNDCEDLLKDPSFRSLFELLVTEIEALDSQFLQEPGVAKDIGRFFNKMLGHFYEDQDLKTCLYLTKVGSYLLQHCLRYDSRAEKYFPNFQEFIENKIAAGFRKKSLSNPDIKNDLIISYLYLVSSYHHLDPETATESQKNDLIKTMARLEYSLIGITWKSKEWDIVIKYSEMFYLWEPHIKKVMGESSKLRDEILNDILADIGVDADKISGEWHGDFPDIMKGEYPINFIKDRESPAFVRKLKEKISTLFGVNLTNSVSNSSNMILFPHEGWEITFSKKQNYFNSKDNDYIYDYRINFKGKKWRYLEPRNVKEEKICLPKGDHLFIEEECENPIILQMRAGKEVARHKMRPCENSSIYFELVESEGEVEQQLLTQERGKGFDLLNWFQPPSATKLIYSPTPLGPQLKKINFTEVDLAFEIQTLNGVKQAVCSDQKTPGFYIAKKQGDDRLKAYSNYLLLENESQDKQVHLIAKPLKQLLGISLLKGLGGLTTTPLIENMMKSPLTKKKFYTYRVNEKGKLESSDPEAVLYLAIFHWSRGDFRQGFDYLIMLQDCGRQAPFSNEVIQLMDYLTMPLLISQTPEAEEMFLRLTAMREENISLHNSKVDLFSNAQILRWITIQMKYNSYLQKIKKGTYPFLDHHQEILIIRSLVSLNSLAVDQGVGKMNEEHQKVFYRLGVGSIVEQSVMLPRIQERYHELRKMDEDEISWGGEVKAFLFETFFGEDKPSVPSLNNLIDTVGSMAKKVTGLSEIIPNQPKEKGLVPALIAFFKQGKEYSFNPKQPMKQEMFSKSEEEKISTRLLDLTPEAIKKNFFYFYRLALEHEEPTIQAEEFQRNFRLLKGKFDDPVVNQMMAILQMVLEKGTKDQFPGSDELEKLFLSDKKTFEEKMKLLVDQAGSWSRWVKKVTRPFKVQSQESVSQLQGKTKTHLLRRLVGNSLTSSYYFYSNTVNLGIKALHSFYVLRKQHLEIQERKVKKNQEFLENNSIDKKLLNLSEECEKAMTQRESAIDKTMKEIFDEYFEFGKQEFEIDGKVYLSNRKKTEEKVDKKLDLTLYEEFPDLKQSLEDYYNRDSSGKGIVKLKKGKNVKALWNKLVRLRNEVDQHLSKERQYAKDFVRSKLLANQDLICKMRGDKIPPVSFKEIDNLFIQEKDKELIERFKIPSEKLPHLKQRLYLYHVMASRWNLLFEKMAELKEPTDKAIPMIAEELQRRRVYDFKGVPERLVRGKVVFESRTGKMLWDKQSSQIDRMLLNPEDRQVVELIMGSGKSWYGIPEIGYYSGFVINIWPAAVAKTNIPLIFRQARKIFNQAASALQISRRIKWVKENSWGLYQIFQRALHHREQINMTKEDLQSSELCYIEKGIAFTKKRFLELKEVGENFWKVLKKVRYDSRGCIDEAHKQFDRRKELNYPLGEKKRLEIKYVEVMTKALYELVSDDEFSKILTIKSEKPSPLSEKEYKDKIQKKLAEKLAASFDFKEQELEEVVVYLCGQAGSIPKGVVESNKTQEIALVKGLLTVFIPEALERTIHVDFNPSKKGNGEYVRPSEGNDNPLEEAIIQSPFEAYVKTAFQLLHDRLKDEQLQKLIDDLKKKAKVRAGRGDPEATLEAFFFQEQCPGYKLFSFDEKDHKEVYKIFRKSDQAVLLYLKNFIAKDIRYSERRLSSNSSNFGSMFRKFYSDTGTPYNEGSYLPGTQVLHDPGTDGESIHMMSRQSEPTRILKNESPRQVLEELIGFCDEDPMIRAIIDRGAVLNGISSDEVANRLLVYITDKRPEMKGVAFYRDGELMMLERGASKAIPAHLSKISEEERLTYFPEPQTYAADVPQVKGAKGIITVASTTCSNEWFQAGYRMRGLDKKNQKLIPVMTERTRQSIVKDESIPDIHEINLFTKRNEERQQRQDNYQADRQKMHDVVRRAILDKSLEAKSFEEAAVILTKFEDFLITKVQDDPFVLFGHIDIEVEPEKIFDLLRERYMTMIKKEMLFSKQDQEKIEKELKQIGHGKYPDKVHSYKVEGELEVDKLDDINKQAQLQSDDEEEVDQENQVENEQQQQAQRLQSDKKPEGKIQDFYTWPEKLNPTSLKWLKELSMDVKNQRSLFSGFSNFLNAKNPVSLFSLSQVLQNSKAKESQILAKEISSRISISRNMLYEDFQRPLEAFGPYQIPLFEVLVIKKGTDEPSFVIINQDEAEYWRKKLEEDRQGHHKSDPLVKIGLYNVSTRGLVAQGKNRFDKLEIEEESFKEIIVHLKFLRGDVNYEKDQRQILKSWLLKNPEAMKFFHTVHEHHAIARIEGSELIKVLMKIDPKRKESWIKI